MSGLEIMMQLDGMSHCKANTKAEWKTGNGQFNM
jgi:hypothetical protein